MTSGNFLSFVLTAAIALASSSAFADGDAKKGKKVFKKCKSCHSMEVDKHKIGPSLAGIMGSKAGTANGFKKYKALKGADFSWDEENISEFVQNQKKFLKSKGQSTKIAMRVKIKAKDVNDLIAYLKSY
jgi:cytochrome c2